MHARAPGSRLCRRYQRPWLWPSDVAADTGTGTVTATGNASGSGSASVNVSDPAAPSQQHLTPPTTTQLTPPPLYVAASALAESNSFFCFSQSFRSFLYMLFVTFSPAASCVGMPSSSN